MNESATLMMRPPRRKVWVLNRHQEKEYREFYRDTEYVIPPKSEKKVMMDLIMAEKFLSQGVTPQQFDQAGREITMGKPLYWEDLTEEERGKLDPIKAEEVRKEEKALKSVCTICGDHLPTAKGLTIHTKRKHPDYEPVREL